MSERPVGYYVHHHGRGHQSRFEKIRSRADFPVVPISQLDLGSGVVLESDLPDRIVDPSAGGALHWAPLTQHLAQRSHRFVEWLMTDRPCGVVVDVSVEAALLCRLAGIPVVVVRQPGDRTDEPHRLAYRLAERLLAPYPRCVEDPSTPAWMSDKTEHVGYLVEQPRISRHSSAVGANDVVVLCGAGGGQLPPEQLDSLASAIDGDVYVAGPRDMSTKHPPTVRHLGWVDDVQALLVNRPLVVASAGLNAVADVLSARCPLVVDPHLRPFDEQQRHAEGLERAQLAVLTPAEAGTAAWRNTLARARQLPERVDCADVIDADARRATAVIRTHLVERDTIDDDRPN